MKRTHICGQAKPTTSNRFTFTFEDFVYLEITQCVSLISESSISVAARKLQIAPRKSIHFCVLTIMFVFRSVEVRLLQCPQKAEFRSDADSGSEVIVLGPRTSHHRNQTMLNFNVWNLEKMVLEVHYNVM